MSVASNPSQFIGRMQLRFLTSFDILRTYSGQAMTGMTAIEEGMTKHMPVIPANQAVADSINIFEN